MFYRTLILVEVLGDVPYTEDIERLAYDIRDGDFSGMELMRETHEVSRDQAAALLTMQGSDPSFLLGDDWTCPGCGIVTSDPVDHVEHCEHVDGTGSPI